MTRSWPTSNRLAERTGCQSRSAKHATAGSWIGISATGVNRKRFRTRSVILAATRLDPTRYSIEDLAEHYYTILHQSDSVTREQSNRSTHLPRNFMPESDRIDALESALYESIMEHPIGDRTPPVHPRELKRRPNNYKLMPKLPRVAGGLKNDSDE